MQRILSRGEIEGLDHTLIPRLRLPQLASVYAERAARFHHLSIDSPLQGYLKLMAHLSEGQQLALASCGDVPGVSESRLSLAQSHGMPPLQAVGWQRDPLWRDMLQQILRHMLSVTDIPAQARAVCDALNQRLMQRPDDVELLADALLARLDDVDGASAPFVMAGLQTYWSALAGRFDLEQLPVVSPFGVCPLCGSLPVSSIVRVGGQADACRYLCCSLCASEWHLVRVTCSHCEHTEKVAYHSIEGGSEAIRAESCDDCRSYRKIFYQHKDPHVDAVADDLASLPLDIMMGEEGYSRPSDNPLLWQNKEG